jgi:hypothetical protein
MFLAHLLSSMHGYLSSIVFALFDPYLGIAQFPTLNMIFLKKSFFAT